MSDYFVTLLAERLTRVLHNRKRNRSIYVYSDLTADDVAIFAAGAHIAVDDLLNLYRTIEVSVTEKDDGIHMVLYNTSTGEDKLSLCAGKDEMELAYREHLRKHSSLAIAERRRRRRLH